MQPTLPPRLLVTVVASLGSLSLGCDGVPFDLHDGSLHLPDCVSALVASCAPAGTCAEAQTTEKTSDYCFASGVHARSAKVDAPRSCNVGVTVVTVMKADGTPCYSFESYVDSDMVCEGVRYTWKNGSGEVVATGVRNGYNAPNTTITCVASAATASCDGPSGLTKGDECCGVSDFGAAVCESPSFDRCTAGACTAQGTAR